MKTKVVGDYSIQLFFNPTNHKVTTWFNNSVFNLNSLFTKLFSSILNNLGVNRTSLCTCLMFLLCHQVVSDQLPNEQLNLNPLHKFYFDYTLARIIKFTIKSAVSKITYVTFVTEMVFGTVRSSIRVRRSESTLS